MKMRSLSRFFMSMLAMCTIAACSNDELGNDPIVDPDASQDAVYMNVQVQLPVAGGSTRSETLPGGGTGITEIGKDYENAVNSVLLVLADTANNFVTAGLGIDINQINSSKGIVSSTTKIDKTKLAKFYDNNGNVIGSKAKMNIYVFCNPTSDLKNKLTENPTPEGTDWIDEIGSIIENANGKVTTGAAIWGGEDHQDGIEKQEGGFLMSTASSECITKKIPKKLEYWNDYTTADKAFNFSGVNFPGDDNKKVDNNGNIKVERAVARFDFKDGSKNGDQEYIIGEDEEQNATLKIKLTKMALVNMSKNFYYLRRVSDNGLPDGANKEICGLEYDNVTQANYVIDTDAPNKQAGISNYSDHFNFCLGSNGETWTIDENARNQWSTYDIADVLDQDQEKDNPWDPNNKKQGEYRIWRYATENTIPGVNNQKHGITTGIVFKGKILPTENPNVPEDLKEALTKATGDSNEDPILYAYANQLYVTWKKVRLHALLDAGPETEFYKAAFGTPTNAEEIFADENDETKNVYSDDPKSPDYLWSEWQKNKSDKDALANFKDAATKSLFTLYQSSTESSTEGTSRGYYCYYYYWNRHNDNGMPGIMGPMEFAVVRNNVYKLAVTKIDRLGHPRLSENDPDPEDPGKPDESDDVYLKLSVEVLPWVVRVNNIEF
ncbi:MAG: Mfa1 family fimbria major subunit [Bacteroides sp.]|nr:Mfa1 family fimbria major subunit [Bacteroides sp.]